MGIRLIDSYSKCTHCNSEFRVSSSKQRFCSSICRGRAYYKANAETEKKRIEAYKLKNPLIAKGIKLKRYYNMTVETYYKMLADQNGVCKICNKTCSTGRELCVDHCHKTGKIRGLLCGKCNTGLGSFNDDKDKMLVAIKYLEDAGVD